MVSKWGQHCDEVAASISQGKGAELVEDVFPAWKQPVEVIFVNALREERDDFEKPSSIRAEALKHWGGK